MRHVVGSAPRPPDRVKTITGNADKIKHHRVQRAVLSRARVERRNDLPRSLFDLQRRYAPCQPSSSFRAVRIVFRNERRRKHWSIVAANSPARATLRSDINGATSGDASVNSSPGSFRSWFLWFLCRRRWKIEILRNESFPIIARSAIDFEWFRRSWVRFLQLWVTRSGSFDNFRKVRLLDRERPKQKVVKTVFSILSKF